VKRQLVDGCDEQGPVKKKPKAKMALKVKERKVKERPDDSKSIPPAKKSKVAANDKDCEVVAVHRPVALRYEWENYRYHLVDEEWQRQGCDLLGIQFVCPFRRQDGGSHVVLTRPDLRSLKSIGGDGNCL